MKIFVKVKAGAKENRVKKTDETHFAVSVKARAHDGQANRAVIEVLAEYFGISKTAVGIISGQASRTKRVEIVI
ncbi:MAG: hypothetical protein A2751_00480 [Candidatus Doudnabacteria bacterium RIFCSPHIGHO2_01_FULL_46_14]|uniref:Uncharacterized protein n=1 Tax=Candidatus Doudnabacteria bacterium RIFCSPHIGHO2_01_FULL_46_14 TaxID=1817824 RepID=A0A1F5NPF0_9BACT|nr:MAG: hypothetical protein A2751_00480 [Candidatus Doudnabacteria bacterium RIFCSPHIGHO2_01_FULL_46_14]